MLRLHSLLGKYYGFLKSPSSLLKSPPFSHKEEDRTTDLLISGRPSIVVNVAKNSRHFHFSFFLFIPFLYFQKIYNMKNYDLVYFCPLS